MLRIEGVQEIRAVARTLDLSQQNTRQRAEQIVRKSALAVERGAKVRAPVDTGALRSSINTVMSGGSGAIVADVGAEVHYGIFLELGTWKMAPQPFLGPAFDEVEPSFIAALEDLGGQALG